MYQQLGVPERKLEGSRLIKGKIQEKGKTVIDVKRCTVLLKNKNLIFNH